VPGTNPATAAVAAAGIKRPVAGFGRRTVGQ
jgi:hypothetical protein